MAPRPVRGFMRAARARLYGWKLDVDAQLFCEGVDRTAPNIVQIVAVRIERRHRLRAQLEGAPDDSNIWILLFQFTNGRLRQPAEWSNVVRKDFDLYRLHNLHSKQRKARGLEDHKKIAGRVEEQRQGFVVTKCCCSVAKFPSSREKRRRVR